MHKLVEFGSMAERTQNKTQSQTLSYLAFSHAENGSLYQVLNFKGKLFSENWVRYWFRQMLEGLKHIHSKGYAHLDLKVESILIDDDLNI